MTTFNTDFANGKRAFPQPTGSESVSVRAQHTLTAAIAANDVLVFGELPDGCVVDDWIVDCDDCDTGATLTADLGILNAAGSAISTAAADGGKWLTASTGLRAAAVIQASAGSVAEQQALLRMNPANALRKVAMVFPAAGTGGVGAKVGLTVKYRATNGSN